MSKIGGNVPPKPPEINPSSSPRSSEGDFEGKAVKVEGGTQARISQQERVSVETKPKVIFATLSQTYPPSPPERLKPLNMISEVIVDAEKVTEVAEKLGVPHLAFEGFELKTVPYGSNHFGMGEYKFASANQANLHSSSWVSLESQGKFLCTSDLRDCIAMVAIDAAGQSYCLYHASKMELRPNHEGSYSFETYFLKDFKEIFGSTQTETLKVYLIGSCYNQDLFVMLDLLRKHDIKVDGCDFPQVSLSDSKEVESQQSIVDQTDIYIGEQAKTLPSLKNALLPSTAVYLDLKLGQVKVHRE